VTEFSGKALPKENQQLQWVDNNNLKQLDFPSANKAIIDALHMPDQYMIADEDVFRGNLLSAVQKQLQQGVSLIQYRSCHANKASYVSVAKELRDLCSEYNAILISNCDLEWVEEINPQGIHLNSIRMKEVYMNQSNGSPFPFEYFSASCHGEAEVQMANQLDVRCQLIGPVNQTKTHADISGIGWSRFSQLCFLANSPVYALGGMNISEYQNAIVHGAQGFAAIRAFTN
jgi:8-oxo-dGTP diphosphatase